MYIDQVKDYMDERPNLTKIEITTEMVPDVNVFVVTKTKETYVFEDVDAIHQKFVYFIAISTIICYNIYVFGIKTALEAHSTGFYFG